MAEKKLNLIQLATGFTAQPCARATKIVGCQFVDSGSFGAILDDVPHDPLRYACSPGLARPANTPEQASSAYAGGLAPGVNGRLHPIGNRYCADVTAFADQVHDGPVILPPLNTRELQLCSLSTAQPAAQQNPKQGAIPFALQCTRIGHLAQRARLCSREPVAQTHTRALRALDSANSGNYVGAQQAGISGLVCKAPYGCQPSINRVGSELAGFEVNSIASHDSLVEGQPRFRAIPLNEFVNGMPITSLRLF